MHVIQRPRKKFIRAIYGFLILCALAIAAWEVLALYAEREIARFESGKVEEGLSTRIYSVPFILDDKSAVPPPNEIPKRLLRLNYELSPLPLTRPGLYFWSPPILTVSLRKFNSPIFHQPSGIFSLYWHGNHWEIHDPVGKSVSQIALEPELMAEISGPHKIRRELAAPAEIPPLLKSAVTAAEDKKFYTHNGIDYLAILRALRADIFRGGGLQGASTISQQLAKNIFLSPRRTLSRKILEAALAISLEARYSKDAILDIYLNYIYLGQDGRVSVLGVKDAARFYFGKSLKRLSLAECATLAGLIRSPYRYNPFLHPRASLRRRDKVLNVMREMGAISIPELQIVLRKPLTARHAPSNAIARRDDSYFTAEIIRELVPRYGEDVVFQKGLSIYSTMDPLLQEAAQKAVERSYPQGALAALDPATGRVLALSGGRDFSKSQFNRATQALRQPGSAFKPFLYGAALEQGLSPATFLEDSPRVYRGKSLARHWKPRNYGQKYFGRVSLREALAHSLNAASLDLAGKIGVKAAIAFAKKMGLMSPVKDNLASMLGASDVNLLELTAAYAPFDNGGFRVSPILVAAITDAQGKIIETENFARTPVISLDLAHLMTSLLQTVVSEGTAKSAARLGWTRPSAGKTGTTNKGADAWFIGYTPQLLAGVWVGDDHHKALGFTGAGNALPIWVSFMKAASADYPDEPFAKPEGLIEKTIDPMSGLLVRTGCPTRLKELFLPGTAPTSYCPLHPGGITGWFKRIFSR
jgi:penicillin-binding protein 1B